MQTQIKQIFVFLLLTLMPIGCFLIDGNYQFGTQTNTSEDTTTYHSQSIEFQDTLSEKELIEILELEDIPYINEWELCDFVDYETGSTITKGFYYKKDEDGSTIYYIVTGINEPYIIEKRVEKQ